MPPSNMSIYVSGFISGLRNPKIPWSMVSSNPTAWIREECYPTEFPWADPSKIRVGTLYKLLDHWRQRQNDGLTPLIWNPSCELLADGDQLLKNVRTQKRTYTGRPHSDESEDSDGTSSDNEEEDLAAEMAKIFNESSESPSPSPSPPPFIQPSHRTASATHRSIVSLQPHASSLSGVHPRLYFLHLLIYVGHSSDMNIAAFLDIERSHSAFPEHSGTHSTPTPGENSTCSLG
jgi:hypothetical protein